MNTLGSERGAAPTLAVFIILVIISSGLVITHLQSMSEEEVSTIQLLMASDVARATNSSINAELNDVLFTGTTAAMYDVGTRKGVRENVEDYVIEYLNNRIEKGWSYPNFENIFVPPADENSLVFEWQADGSINIWGYLESQVKHVKKPSAYGTFLHISPPPRFQRLKHVANQVKEKVGEVPENQISTLQNELNENYECEGIEINLTVTGSQINIDVMDVYGGKTVVLNE